MRKIPRGEELRKRAEELGVSQSRTYVVTPANDLILDEPELQRRVLEAERHRRDARMWVMALVSAIASGVSALAAWAAILTKGGNP